MTLNTALAGEKYQLLACIAPAKLRSKLETLGLIPGERLHVIQNTGAGIIIEVKRSRLAIAHDLAGFLVVCGPQERPQEASQEGPQEGSKEASQEDPSS